MAYNKKHLLIVLLALEMVILRLFISIMACINFSFSSLVMLFLVVVVCEAGLGLTLLVRRVYFYGRDYFSSFNSLW